jgi:putative thiamine transport system substrate-binding protein
MLSNRRTVLKWGMGTLALGTFPAAGRAANWAETEAAARGQEVYFNAWAGSEAINAYIAWAGAELKSRYDVTLRHVKITDAAETVRRVRDEVAAGKKDGSVDLMWINGENFRAMKSGGLLFGPFTQDLPNFALVDTAGKPTTLRDFTEPTDGLESPWGMAQLTFFGDGAKLGTPPRSVPELLAFAEANPGRVTYPAPPDFHGTTFLKQVLIEMVGAAQRFSEPVAKAEFLKLVDPWFAALDRLHRSAWKNGKQFPPSQAQLTQMVADGEILIGITFNPNEAANLVAQGSLPATTLAWQHSVGTIGNTHFLAIPANARAREAAQVTANFMLSPEAQARKADLTVWGDPTVLDLSKLSSADAGLFTSASAPGSVSLPGPAIPEPHADWVTLVEASWLERYGT